MGGAVDHLFFLPWLDFSPVKSIRYRPDWHKWLYGVFVVSTSWCSPTSACSRRRRFGERVSQFSARCSISDSSC
jgi:quinol-cytochrome oxidoreductase complex cytochrome b subunit